VAGSWIRLYNEELAHFTPNTVRVIELSRMRWAGHVAHTG